MICLLPTLHCGGSLPPCLHQTPPLLGERRKRPRPRPVSQEAQAAASAAMSHFVSRSSNPLSAACRGVAQLFLTSISASPADQRRTDETSNPDWANHCRVIRHPSSASSAPSALRSLFRGSLSARTSLGSIPCTKPSRASSRI